MSVKIRIPTQLRALAGGAGEVQVEGSTVGEALKSLDAAHPGFAQRLFDESGNLRRFVNVFVGEEDVRFLEGLQPRSGLVWSSQSCRRWRGGSRRVAGRRVPASRAASGLEAEQPACRRGTAQSLRASARLRCTVSTRRV